MKKMLLLGIMPGLTQDQLDAVKRLVEADFPEHTVRFIVGMLSAAEIDVNVTVARDERVSNGYL